MVSILITRINLIFTVALTLFADSSLLDNIYCYELEKRRWGIEKSDEEQKPEQSSVRAVISQSSHQSEHCLSSIAFYKQKWIKLMITNMFQSDDYIIPFMKFRKFHIDPKIW